MDIKIATTRCLDPYGRTRVFHYYLIVDYEQGQTFSCENYGIRILEENGAQASIPAITTSARRIDQLLTLLVDNQVGPAGALDVVHEQI